MGSQKWRKVAALAVAAVVTAGGVVWANGGFAGSDTVYCKTKAGYLRISATGECRRSEVQVDMPSADDFNALNARVDALAGQVDALQSSNDDLSASDADIKGKLTELRGRLDDSDMRVYLAMYLNMNDPQSLSGSLVGKDLSGISLPGVTFEFVDARKVNLSDADLRGGYFKGTVFKMANFTGANLSNAFFGWANLAGVNFTGANLSGVDFREANLSGANFEGANLTGAHLESSYGNVVGTPAVLPGGWCLDGTFMRCPVKPVQSEVNGHFYELVRAPLDWYQAKAQAEGMSYKGLAGHLATVTSSEENDLVTGLLQRAGDGYPAWIGAAQTEPAAGYSYSYAWQSGPESGQVFIQCVGSSRESCSSPGGAFSAWGRGFPDWVSEKFVQAGYEGGWNNCTADAWCGANNGFVVEYEPDWRD